MTDRKHTHRAHYSAPPPHPDYFKALLMWALAAVIAFFVITAAIMLTADSRHSEQQNERGQKLLRDLQKSSEARGL